MTAHTHPEGATDPLVARLSALDVCCVSDALDALNLDGYIDALTPIWEGARLVGRAVTTKLAEGPAPAGSAPVHLGARAIERARPGEVIVVDNQGRDRMGSWGGLLARAAQLAGVAGVVLDGACRDADEARELGFPAFARRAVARTARGRVHEESCGEPISLCGLPVASGDVVMADASGVVVLAAARAQEIVERAEMIARREAAMVARLRAGDRISQVLGADYEHMLRG